MSPLVMPEILGSFFNTLTADDKYSLHKREHLPEPIEMQLSKKQKNSPNFLLHSSNMHQILKVLKQKMTLIADVFRKLRTANNVVT